MYKRRLERSSPYLLVQFKGYGQCWLAGCFDGTVLVDCSALCSQSEGNPFQMEIDVRLSSFFLHSLGTMVSGELQICLCLLNLMLHARVGQLHQFVCVCVYV